MPKQQRMMRVEQKGQMETLARLESKSDEELMRETRYRAYALMLLGQRAAERRDPKAARAHFQKALAAAKPQERLQIRRVADVALAAAESRANDYQVAAARLGLEGPTKGQMRGLKIMALLAPPQSAGSFARVRGILIILGLIVGILFAGFGIVSGVAAVTGGLSLDLRIFYGLVLVFVAIAGLVFFGRRRQKAAKAKREEEIAARTGKR